MNYLAIISKPAVTLATDRRVLPAEDIHQLDSVKDLVSRLNELLQSEYETLQNRSHEAFEQGFAAGREEGLNSARAEYTDQLLDLSRRYQARRTELADYAVNLAVQMVQRIAEDIGPATTVAAIARKACQEFAPETAIIVCVHPDHSSYVQQQIHQFHDQKQFSQDAGQQHHATHKQLELIEVRSDSSLGPLDCSLITKLGTITAGLDQQLERLRKVLTSELSVRLGTELSETQA